MTNRHYQNVLEDQLALLGHNFDAQTLEKLLCYHALLMKWNKAYNLTSVRDPLAMITRHIVDSLSVLSFIDSAGFKSLADVGSGAGLPGVLLAICRPELNVTSIDSNGKKTRFQNQVKIELALDNLSIIRGRAEDCQGQMFDAVISRAFASLADMIRLTHQLCSKEGVFLAMKANISKREIAQLPVGYALVNSHTLVVPNEEGERHLLEIRRV